MGRTLTHGSLFAGIGGFDLGFERQGFKTVWCIENDPRCQRLLTAKFPDAQIFGDVRKVGADQLARVDVITYGFPCQDVSVLGLRAGLDGGKRSNLFYEATRIIGELRPTIAVGENVTGLLSADNGQAMCNVAQALSQVGHRDLSWRTINARSFGFVQSRRRVFIVSTDSDPHGDTATRCSFRVLHQFGNPTASAPPPPPKQNSRVAASDALEGEDFVVVSHATPGLTAYRWEDFPTIVCHGWYLFLADKKAQTCRYFTPLEYEKLQGFPPGWTDGFPKTIRYRMIGNSVVPAVAEYVARGCRRVLEGDEQVAFVA